jgi:hypothetical protein
MRIVATSQTVFFQDAARTTASFNLPLQPGAKTIRSPEANARLDAAGGGRMRASRAEPSLIFRLRWKFRRSAEEKIGPKKNAMADGPIALHGFA